MINKYDMTKPNRTLQTKKTKFLRSEPGVKNATLTLTMLYLMNFMDKQIEILIKAAVQYDHNTNNTPSSSVSRTNA